MRTLLAVVIVLFGLLALLAGPSLSARQATPQGGSPPLIRSARLQLFQGTRFIGQLVQRAQRTPSGALGFSGQFLGLRPGGYTAQAQGFASTNGSGPAVARASGTATVTARRTVILRLHWQSSGRQLVSIDVTPSEPVIQVGQERQFTATGHYSDGSQQNLTESVVWSSSSPSVAHVGNAAGVEDLPKGRARGLSVGETDIIARDPATNIQGDALLTVQPPPRTLVSITVTPANQLVLVNRTLQYTATGTFSDGSQQDITNSVNWSSSNTAAATIGNGGVDQPPKGLATTRGSGGDVTTITATDPATNIQGSTQLFTLD